MPQPAALCPHCEATVNFSKPPQLGQRVTCKRCGEYLEVYNLKPIELDYEYSDDDDDYDYDDDD